MTDRTKTYGEKLLDRLARDSWGNPDMSGLSRWQREQVKAARRKRLEEQKGRS